MLRRLRKFSWEQVAKSFQSRIEALDLFDEHETARAKEDPWYLAGAMTYFFWIVTVVSGLLLVLWYVPTTNSAFLSIERIMTDIPLGWLIRGIHKYGADALIITATLRVYRLYFSGDYKAPHELTWILSIVILLAGMFSGLTGYLLIWNQRAYWATKVFATFPTYFDMIPVLKELHLGFLISNIMVGGAAVSQATMTRFYMAHYTISMIGLILVELHFIKRKLPRFTMTLGQMAMGFTMLVVASIVLPAASGRPADPNLTPHRIYSDWYFLALYHMMRIFPGFWAVMGTLVIPLIAWAMPFLDHGKEKHWLKRPMFTTVGIMALVYFFAFSLLLILNIADIRRDPPIFGATTVAFLGAGALWQWLYNRSQRAAGTAAPPAAPRPRAPAAGVGAAPRAGGD